MLTQALDLVEWVPMSPQPNQTLPMAHQVIRALVCPDLSAGRKCENCAEKAARFYNMILDAQREDRETNALVALDTLARLHAAKEAA